MKFLKEADKATVKEIDKQCKNKWSWKWTDEEISRDVPRLGRSVTYKFKDCIDKVDEQGVAFCSWCKDKICYGSEGKKAFTKHFNRAKHVKEFLIRATNYQLSASCSSTSTSTSSQACENFPIFKNIIAKDRKSVSSAPEGSGPSVLPQADEAALAHVCMSDRIVQTEAMILGFVAEHSLPISLADPLTELIKEVSRGENHFLLFYCLFPCFFILVAAFSF